MYVHYFIITKIAVHVLIVSCFYQHNDSILLQIWTQSYMFWHVGHSLDMILLPA